MTTSADLVGLADRLEAVLRLDLESHAGRSEICACIDELRALDGGWLPIESAPEDVPVWCVDAEGHIWIGCRVYVENEGYAWTNCYHDFDRHNGKWQTDTADWDDDYQPINWQPLPEPLPPSPAATVEG